MACATTEQVHRPNYDERHSDIKVISYNIWYDYENEWESRKLVIEDFLKNSKADIIGLQEVKSAVEEYFLEENRPMQWLVEEFDDYILIGDSYFNPILVKRDRFEVVESGLFWHSETPELSRSNHWGAIMPRNSVWAILDDSFSGKKILIVNSHLDPKRNVRNRSVDLIVSRIPADIPAILTGDFNALPGSQSISKLWEKGFRDATKGLSGTFRLFSDSSSAFALWRLDYVFTRGFTPIRAYVNEVEEDGLFGSDHHPVTAIVRPGYPPIFR